MHCAKFPRPLGRLITRCLIAPQPLIRWSVVVQRRKLVVALAAQMPNKSGAVWGVTYAVYLVAALPVRVGRQIRRCLAPNNIVALQVQRRPTPNSIVPVKAGFGLPHRQSALVVLKKP